eukprot:SAG31_NODE_48488_length_185_cov_23.558140_1_plen_20_part_10
MAAAKKVGSPKMLRNLPQKS